MITYNFGDILLIKKWCQSLNCELHSSLFTIQDLRPIPILHLFVKNENLAPLLLKPVEE